MRTLISRHPKLFGSILLSGIACGVLLTLMAIGRVAFWLELPSEPFFGQGIYGLTVEGLVMLMHVFCALVLLLSAIIFFIGSSFGTITAVTTILASFLGYTCSSWVQVWDSLTDIYHFCSSIVGSIAWALVIIFTIFELPALLKPACLKLGRWLERQTGTRGDNP